MRPPISQTTSFRTRIYLSTLIAVTAFLLSGCTFAKYSKVRVHVVDEQTQAGIPKARVRTFYVKPMLDMTYQRKDREKTDRDGFATLTVATNWSQRMILGWTHGIMPHLSVEADGYLPRDVRVGNELGGVELLLIQMAKTSGPNHALLPTPGSGFSSAARFAFTDPASLIFSR